MYVKWTKLVDWCVCVGGRLKIGKVVLAIVVTLAHPRDALVDLTQDICARQATTGTEAAIVAEGAAALGHSAVDVGASKASINTYLLYPFSKTLPQHKVQCPIAQPCLPPRRL